MRKLKNKLKRYLRKFLIAFRNKKNLTQEQAAALLHISCRSYSDLESGKYCLSAVALILFLGQLPDKEILEIVRGFRTIADEAEKEDAA